MATAYTGSLGTYYAGNEFLTTEEMAVNGLYIWRYLGGRGWSMNAVAGMLGNMETESSVNPAIWQNLISTPSNGFGLVQWTPSTKYTSWCEENGLDPASMDSALKRIEYEIENGLQWIPTDTYPLSFAEFKTTTVTPTVAADMFIKCYERPAEPDQPARGEQAEIWYLLIKDNGGDIPDTPSPSVKTNKMPLWLIVAASRR